MSLTNEILYEMIRDKGFTPAECRTLIRPFMDEVGKERVEAYAEGYEDGKEFERKIKTINCI